MKWNQIVARAKDAKAAYDDRQEGRAARVAERATGPDGVLRFGRVTWDGRVLTVRGRMFVTEPDGVTRGRPFTGETRLPLQRIASVQLSGGLNKAVQVTATDGRRYFVPVADGRSGPVLADAITRALADAG